MRKCNAMYCSGDHEGNRDLMQLLEAGFYPVKAPPDIYITWNGALAPTVFIEVKEKHTTKSLRSLAREYGVSHEAVRRMLRAVK